MSLVSIVLCTYNGELYLKEQIDSILAQDYSNFELLISDDASTDNTRDILKAYESDKRVQVFYQEKNLGLTRNFSFAVHKAKGDLIAFSDQDDIWLPHKIATLVKAIGDSPLVYSDSLLVNEKGESMNKKLSELKNMYSGTDSRCYILYSCVWGHGMLVRKELLQKCDPMPPSVHHDIWIVFQAFMNGGIKYHDEVLTHYRQHATSTSKTLPQKVTPKKDKDRYNAYRAKLDWIKLMHQNERPEYKDWYAELVRLYEAKKKGYVFGLVIFMMRYRKEIFRLSKKGFASQVVEILKQGRGERE